ncbi:MAG: hypothetical protein SGARI_004026 [Bacillariaceae sp.]
MKGPSRRTMVDGIVELEEDDIASLLSTCRLLGMTHYDYDSNGYNVLEMIQEGLDLQRLDLNKFKMKAGGPAMEYRAYHWMERLAAATAKEMQAALDDGVSLEDLDDSSSTEYNAHLVRQGELETVQLLQQYARQQAKKQKRLGYNSAGGGAAIIDEDSFLVRQEPCQ